MVEVSYSDNSNFFTPAPCAFLTPALQGQSFTKDQNALIYLLKETRYLLRRERLRLRERLRARAALRRLARAILR